MSIRITGHRAFWEYLVQGIRYEDSETHYIRRAVCAADPTRTRILIGDLGSYVYSVVCETKTVSALAVVAYIHEDGIRIERDRCEPEHPTHAITCLTDLFQEAQPVDPSTLNSFTTTLMQDRQA